MKVISETCHAHLIQYLHLYCVRYLMKVISETCHTLNSISTLYWCEVTDESYSDIYIFIDVRYHAHLIQYLHLYWCEVPDESYFRNVSCTLNSIICIQYTFVLCEIPDEGYFRNVCIGVRYLMKVISETCHAHLIQYLHLYWCEVPDECYFRNVSCTLNSISTFVLVWGTWWKLFQKRVMHT